MSDRPQITALLSLSIEKHINPHNDPRIYWAKEVTFDYSTSNAIRVDYMKFKPVYVGVFVPGGMNYRGEWYDLKSIKKAKRKDRTRPVSEMLLMMFRSAARERKCRKCGNATRMFCRQKHGFRRRDEITMIEIINTYNTTTKELEAFTRSLPAEDQEPYRPEKGEETC